LKSLEVLVLLGSLLGALALGAPVFLAIILAALAVFALFPGSLPPFVFAQSFVQGLESYSFAAIPFFFIAGEIMNAGGISRRLLDFARALVGHLRGGLSHVNILANAAMSGVSGSAVADAAAIGAVVIPAMKRQGFPAAYAAAVTANAAMMGPIIPPSIPLVLYGLFASVSVGRLFVGGIVPGLLMAAVLFGVSYAISVRRRYPAGDWEGWGRVGSTLRDGLVAFGLPVLIIVAKVGGVATTTELGAVAVLYAAFVSLVVYRELTMTGLWAAICRGAVDSCGVLLIASVSGVFAWLVASLGAGAAVASFISSVTTSPTGALALVTVLLLVAGTALEPITMLLVLIPVLIPVASALGIDLVHFGLVTVLATTVGLITPPVGFLVYLTAAQAKAPIGAVTRECWPFTVALVALLFVIVVTPDIVLWLPNALGVR
jgi:tripartite ATP-independent transporter DctM subunit